MDLVAKFGAIKSNLSIPKKKRLFLKHFLCFLFGWSTIVEELVTMKKIGVLFLAIGNFVFGQSNQNLECAKLESGIYPVYKAIEKGYNSYAFELAQKHCPVQILKEGERTPKILIKRAGIIEELFAADLPTCPAYYFGGNAEINVTVLNQKIYYYGWSEKTGARIDYILSNSKPAPYLQEKEALELYRNSIKIEQTTARDDRKQLNAELAAKEAAENTLNGKSIKSIQLKMIDPPSEIGMLSVVAIGIEVTLTNGQILKTKNLGGLTPYTDFEVSVKGGDFAGGDFKVANDSRQIPNDKIEIQVWSKFDKTVSGSFSHPINYKNNIFYQYQGSSGASGRGAVVGKSINGGHGTDGRSVNILAEKQVVNGQNIIKVTLTDALTGEILAEAKVHADYKITLNVCGGNGGSGDKGPFADNVGGNGGDGGNGGNVSVSGTGAQQLLLVVMNTGGNAGAGGAGNTSYDAKGQNGTRGTNGSFIK